MKKILPAILILIAIFVIWFVFKQASNVSPTNNQTMQPLNVSLTHPDPSNATFTIDNQPITLSKGTNEEDIIPGGELTQDTNLTNLIAYGDLNGDKKDDAAVVLIQSGSGSGVFIYIAAYVSGLLNYKGSNAIFIGDRIDPKSISISNGVITFNYLDRKPDEPYAADPTVPTSKQFVYSNGTLVEKN